MKEEYVDSVCGNVETSLRNFKRCDEVLARKGKAQDPMIIPFVFRLEGAYLRLRERKFHVTALSREALCFHRRHEWNLEEVRSPSVSWQKSRSLASAWRRLSLSGSEYPVRSPAGALLRSPIRITQVLSLGCFGIHAAMISQTSFCSTGLAAVNWYN